MHLQAADVSVPGPPPLVLNIGSTVVPLFVLANPKFPDRELARRVLVLLRKT